MIEKFYLQGKNPILEAFRVFSPEQSTVSQTFGGATPYIFWGTVFAVILVFGFIGLRYLKGKVDYDNKTDSPEYGFWNILVKGRYMVEGWLSLNESIDQDEELDRIEDEARKLGLGDLVDYLRQIRKEKTFKVYNLKRTDNLDLLEKKGKRTRIITTTDIMEKENHWEMQSKGKRGITSILKPRKPLMAVLAHNTSRIEIENVDKNADEYFVGGLEPMPDTAKEYYIDHQTTKQILVTIHQITHPRIVAKLVDVTPILIKTVIEKEHHEKENKSLTELIETEFSKKSKINAKYMNEKSKRSQKKYIDLGEKKTLREFAGDLGMIVISMFFGFILTVMFPDLFPSLPPLNAQLFGFGVAVILVGVMITVRRKRNKDQQEELEEDKEITR